MKIFLVIVTVLVIVTKISLLYRTAVVVYTLTVHTQPTFVPLTHMSKQFLKC